MIKVSAFRWVPPFAQGLVRDFRVRWALEEAGMPYEEMLIGPQDQSSGQYRALQPFGQVPAMVDNDLEMFESGAIVLHIAERSQALMPAEETARARVKTWIFAALNSIEPHVGNLADIDLFNADQDWARARRPAVEAQVDKRLSELAAALGDRDYLEGPFTAGDLMMTTVLRELRQTDLVARHPSLEAYRLRNEARPAFKKAMADHMAPFAKHAPPGM